MKKTIIGSLVGAIIIFFWQFLSWGPLNLHRSAQGYTPKQDSIMAYLNSQFKEDGNYLMPTYVPGATSEEMDKAMKNAVGKPWAILSYHRSMDMSMGMNMIRGFLVNVIILWLLCWLIGKMNEVSVVTILITSLIVGLIGFLNVTYTYHIWYQTKDLNAHLIDTVVSWGITGLWLGLWLKKK